MYHLFPLYGKTLLIGSIFFAINSIIAEIVYALVIFPTFVELECNKAMLKKPGTCDNSLMHPVFEEPISWRMRHLRFYDEEDQLTQPDSF